MNRSAGHYTALITFVVAALVAASCSSTPESSEVPAGALVLVHQRFTLSPKKNKVQLGEYAVHLISIDSDGLTKIRVDQTGKELSAKPGEYFVSYEFGQIGLRLESVTNGVASFFSQACGPIEEIRR